MTHTSRATRTERGRVGTLPGQLCGAGPGEGTSQMPAPPQPRRRPCPEALPSPPSLGWPDLWPGSTGLTQGDQCHLFLPKGPQIFLPSSPGKGSLHMKCHTDEILG